MLSVAVVCAMLFSMTSAEAALQASSNPGIGNMTAIVWKDIDPWTCTGVTMPATLSPQTQHFQKANWIVFSSAYKPGSYCSATYQDQTDKSIQVVITVWEEENFGMFMSTSSDSRYAVAGVDKGVPYGAEMQTPQHD